MSVLKTYCGVHNILNQLKYDMPYKKCNRIPKWRQRYRTHPPMQERKWVQFHPSVGKIPWSRKWQPTPVFLLGESQAQRSLSGYVQKVTEQDKTKAIQHSIRNAVYTFLKTFKVGCFQSSLYPLVFFFSILQF